MSDLVAFVEQVVDMTPWQRRLLEQVGDVSDLTAAFEQGTLRLATGGHRYAKRLTFAVVIAEALESGEHVHIAEPSGPTCINGTCA